ncbi:MAG TPA: hypothetical protein VMB70_07770, partial [Terriglobia bacterium]|nr:hypothetical protein [Terriglobia bacterium]
AASISVRDSRLIVKVHVVFFERFKLMGHLLQVVTQCLCTLAPEFIFGPAPKFMIKVGCPGGIHGKVMICEL